MDNFENHFSKAFSDDFYRDFNAFSEKQFPFLSGAGSTFSSAFVSPLTARVTPEQWRICADAIRSFQKLRTHPVFIKKMSESFSTRFEIPASNIPRSLFQAYDFHLGERGPRLIEINTNAGFALGSSFFQEFTHTALATHFKNTYKNPAAREAFWDDFENIFGEDFATLAIVDEAPLTQALYFEFLLFKNFLENRGKKVIVCDPSELSIKSDGLYHQNGARVDALYNRLTDFYFAAANNCAIKQALQKNFVKVSPHPFDFYCLADKSRMIDFSDPNFLSEFLSEDEKNKIDSVLLDTERVTPVNESKLWENRKKYFFKPFESYGGKAVYAGRGITKTVWEHIKTHDYIAQEICPAAKVSLTGEGFEKTEFKFDIRFFVFGDEIRLAGPRFYQGQTTNFRTLLGGFGSLLIDEKS